MKFWILGSRHARARHGRPAAGAPARQDGLVAAGRGRLSPRRI